MQPEKDIYFQKALQAGYLARSAYKLLQIDEVFNIFEGATKAIDLCSAPGSWTQVIYNKLHKVLNNYDPSKLNPNVKIVSVDMMPMDHFPGVVHLQADISQYATMKEILEQFDNEKADVVVCDGAIDVVGMKMIDYYMHHRIFLSALYIVLNTLKNGGTFVIKIFIAKGHERIVHKLKVFFEHVTIVKPHCSRNKEAFAVCRNYIPLPGFDPIQLTPFIELQNGNFSNLDSVHRKLIPYLCADCYEYEMKQAGLQIKKLSNRGIESNLINMLNIIFKDKLVDIKILRKRLSKQLPIYQISKDNCLEYDDETNKVYFDGLGVNKDEADEEETSNQEIQERTDCNDTLSEEIKPPEMQNSDQVACNEDESVIDETRLKNEEDLHKFAEMVEVSHSGKSHMPLELNTSQNDNIEEFVMNCCQEVEEKRSEIRNVLGEKIKALQLENRGKFCGRGFNVDDWKFFSNTDIERGIISIDDQKLKKLHQNFHEVYKQIDTLKGLKAKTLSMKELFNKQEQLKTEIREGVLDSL